MSELNARSPSVGYQTLDCFFQTWSQHATSIKAFPFHPYALLLSILRKSLCLNLVGAIKVYMEASTPVRQMDSACLFSIPRKRQSVSKSMKSNCRNLCSQIDGFPCASMHLFHQISGCLFILHQTLVVKQCKSTIWSSVDIFSKFNQVDIQSSTEQLLAATFSLWFSEVGSFFPLHCKPFLFIACCRNNLPQFYTVRLRYKELPANFVSRSIVQDISHPPLHSLHFSPLLGFKGDALNVPVL